MRPFIHMYRSATTSRKSAFRRPLSRAGGLLAAVALLVLAACGDGGTGPDTRVAEVAVSPATRELTVGDVAQLHAVVTNRAGDPLEEREVVWTTSDPGIAEVSGDGEVQAVGVGRAWITATSDGIDGTARIDVAEAPPAAVDRVELDATVVPLAKYATRTLVARVLDAEGNELEGRTVTWTSQTPEIATVDAAGLITARAEGETRIFAAVGDRSAWADVLVARAPVARIVLTPPGAEMDPLETGAIGVRLEDDHGLELADRQIAWTVGDAGVLRIEGNGFLYALAEGRSTITASSEGVSATTEVRVVPAPAFDLLFDHPTTAGGAEIFLLGFERPTLPVRLNAGNVSRDPSASPDSGRYVFAVSQRDFATGAPQNDLFAVNVNGMYIERLTSMPGVEQEPAWSPDGKRIAFSATDAAGRTDIWVMLADGTGLVNLTAAMGEWSAERAPAWSPDGARIAFAASFDGVAGRIWTMRPDGSDRRELATDVGHGMHPTWSPDGTRIAFHYYAGVATGADIAIAPAAGGAATRLALPGDQMSPAWSPDGALIAFTGVSASGGFRLWTVRPDGTGARDRTAGRNPSWIAR